MIALTPLQWLFALAVIALGTAIQASMGFGLALIAAPLLYLVDPLFVPGPLIMTAWTLSAWVVWRERHALEPAHFKVALAGRLLGAPPAALLVGSVSAAMFDLVFASLVLLAVGLSLLHSSVRPTPRNIFLATAASGFMGTISGIDGPPLALVFQNARGANLRANLGMLFLIGTTVSLLLLAVVGLMGPRELLAGLLLQAGVAAGVVLAVPLRQRVDRANVRPLLLALCTLSAMVVLVRALLSLR